jgi:hypothetical protein
MVVIESLLFVFCSAGKKLVMTRRAGYNGSGFSCTCFKLDHLAAFDEVLFQTFCYFEGLIF